MPPTLTSSSNVLTVVFKSDSSIAHDGFSASYTALDGSLGTISHKKSLITIFGHKHQIKNFIKII